MPYIPTSKKTRTFFSKGNWIALGFSVLWGLVVLDYLWHSAWFSHRHDLTPAEFVGSLCGLALPILIAFLVGQYFDRDEKLANETKILQNYIKGLVYPDATSAVYTKTLTTELQDNLKSFHNVLKALEKQTAEISGGLTNWHQELDKLMRHIDTKTFGALQTFSTHVQTLTQETHKATDMLTTQTAALEKVTASSVGTIGALSKDLTQNIDDIANRTHAMENITTRTAAALTKVQGISGALQSGTQQLEKVITSYQTTTQEQQARLLEETAKVIEAFKAHGLLLGQEVDKTTQRFALVEKTFNENAQSLFHQADESIFHLNEAGALFDTKADHLKAVMEQLQGHLNTLTESITTSAEGVSTPHKKTSVLSSDLFLKEAKVVLDGLQTCSVDMAKIFTPKNQEALWEKYYAGDKAVFMRHITKEISTSTAQKIRALHTQNPAFKMAVSQYMNGFEALSSQMTKPGQDPLLLNLLLGSDIGRVYMVLADIFKK